MMRDQRPKDYFTETEIELLRTKSSFRGVMAVMHCWAVILTAWVVVLIWTNVFTIVLAFN